MNKDKLMMTSSIEVLLGQIAQALFNIYSPNDLRITHSKYHQIINNLNEIEKILQEART